jgi:LysM repeat protein
MANSGGSCTAFASRAGITLSQLYAWNSVLGSNGENCNTQFWGEEYYCVGVSSTTTVSPTTSKAPTSKAPPTTATTSTSTKPTAPGPTQSGIISTCTTYLKANTGGSCPAFASRAGISLAQLYTWNPILGSSGQNCATQFWGEEYYCVGISSTSPSSAPPSSQKPTSTKIAAPGPTQTGITANCNKYLMANPGGNCVAFAQRAGISTAQLYDWNTVLGRGGVDCNAQFWGNEFYCVGVSG